MNEVKDPVMKDMIHLAITRCRAAFNSVSQLMDDAGDLSRASLALTIATDMIMGAASLLRDSKRFRHLNDRELFNHLIEKVRISVVQELLEDEELEQKQSPKPRRRKATDAG